MSTVGWIETGPPVVVAPGGASPAQHRLGLMMWTQLLCPYPARIGIVGLEDGALAAWCLRHISQAHVEVAEGDADVIARSGALLTSAHGERLRIHLEDGCDLVERSRRRLDLLFVNRFDALRSSVDSFRACFDSLTDDGVAVFSLDRSWRHGVALLVQAFGGRCWLMSSLHSEHEIVFAQRPATPLGAALPLCLLEMRAAWLAKRRPIDLRPACELFAADCEPPRTVMVEGAPWFCARLFDTH